MASVSAVRSGLKTRLATISGLNAYDTVPGTIATPAAVVEPGDPVVSYDDTMDAADTINLSVLILVQYSDQDAAQAALDGYLDGSGAGSVRAVVDAEPTLGGAAAYCRVVSAGNYGTYQFNSIDYLGVRFAVEVGS